jgi:hypothetical protein
MTNSMNHSSAIDTVIVPVKKFHFMEPERSSPCSQNPTIHVLSRASWKQSIGLTSHPVSPECRLPTLMFRKWPVSIHTLHVFRFYSASPFPSHPWLNNPNSVNRVNITWLVGILWTSVDCELVRIGKKTIEIKFSLPSVIEHVRANNT